MYFTYKDLDIYYEVIGKGEPIVFLHGWGSSLNSFEKQINYFKDKYTLYLIDLPGFGMSSEIEEDFILDDYVDVLREFILSMKLNDPVIISHSFGGRILIKYTLDYKVKACIFIGSAGIKHFKLRYVYFF